MNENLDLTKILEGCPERTKFYSPLFGEVRLHRIYGSYGIGVVCVRMNRLYEFNAAGKYEMVEMGCSDSRGNYYYSDECLLFPSKDQRDWSKFERFWDNNPKVEKFDPNTLQLFDKILVRDCPDELWSIEFFSHKTGNIVRGLCSNWIYAIPFNEETKHLANKREDCPEYYKWWEK